MLLHRCLHGGETSRGVEREYRAVGNVELKHAKYQQEKSRIRRHNKSERPNGRGK